MDTARSVLVGTTTPTFMGVVFVSTCLSLSLRPTFVPLVFLISVLIVYSRATINRPFFTHRFFALLSTLSVATVTAFSSSADSALSTRFLSSGLLLVVAVIFSLVALTPVLAYGKARGYVGAQSAFAGLLLFPALWTTTWTIFVHISPLGRIGSWTPMTGIEGYSWLMPMFGQAGIDYVTALWAVVVAEYVGQWTMGPGAREHLPDEASPNVDLLTPIGDEHEANAANGHNVRSGPRNPVPYILGLLLLATIPAYQAPRLPLPTHSPNTTELTVSCVHPFTNNPGTPLDFSDYLAETITQASRAKVLLWPEGAVRFLNEKERSQAFAIIANVSYLRNAWIAIGYEQLFSESGETSHGKRVRGHNGVAIFGPKQEPVTYIKRKLVPLVESFSYETSINSPPKYLVPIPKPNQRPKSDKSWPRTIPITTAICLDVASPLANAVPVNSTDSDTGRPALILAPARTWHPDIGKAMFSHASMRATEQGASILWCDGGEGGVSGIGGLAASGLGPLGGIGQVGTGGSWVQTIGIPYPYDAKHFVPTWYSLWGDLSVLFLAWAPLVFWFAAPFGRGLKTIYDAGARRIRPSGDGRNGVQRNESTPLLVDA